MTEAQVIETPISNQAGDLHLIDNATGDRRNIGRVELVAGKWLAVANKAAKPRAFKTHEGACDYLCRLVMGW